MQRRTCAVCQDGGFELSKGLECGDPEHFVCPDCLEQYVNDFQQPDQARKRALHEGRVPCPGVGCKAHFSEWALARALSSDAFAAYSEARLKLLEDRLSQEMDEEVKCQVEAELQKLAAMDEEARQVLRHRRHITEHILNHKCPRCGKVRVPLPSVPAPLSIPSENAARAVRGQVPTRGYPPP